MLKEGRADLKVEIRKVLRSLKQRRQTTTTLRACLVTMVPFRSATVSTVKRVFFPF